ncbi:MAG: hypothetical protein AB7O73_01095 [Bacteroidia bacterium]
MKTKLLFVYNADGGLFSKVSDFAHKILSPSTYPCSLCALTYDNFGIKNEWAEFLSKLNVEQEFFHKDDFLKKHKHYETTFPAIFLEKETTLQLLIPSAMIDACISLQDLEQIITAKLNSLK